MLTVSLSGCEPTPQKNLRRAKGLVISGSDLEKAESLLKSVLDKQPQNFEARRQLAEVYRQRDQYKRAEGQLKALWKAGGFDKSATDDGGRRRSMKTLLQEQLVQLYREWATLLHEQGNTEEMVQVCRRGLAFDPTQAELNRLLVDHYWERAQRLVEEGKKEAAADAYSQILDLRTEPEDSRRETARSRVTELRDEAFNERVRASFRSEVVPTLDDIEAIALENETLKIDFLTTVDQSLNPDAAEGARKIRREALLKLMDIVAPRIIMPVTGLSTEADYTVIDEAQRLELLKMHLDRRSITFVPGGAVVKGEIPVTAIVPMARAMRKTYLAQQTQEANTASTGEAGPDAGSLGGPDADGGQPE
jgi:hypothetical protein